MTVESNQSFHVLLASQVCTSGHTNISWFTSYQLVLLNASNHYIDTPQRAWHVELDCAKPSYQGRLPSYRGSPTSTPSSVFVTAATSASEAELLPPVAAARSEVQCHTKNTHVLHAEQLQSPHGHPSELACVGHPQNPSIRLKAGCRPFEAAPHPLLPPHLSVLPAQPPAAARQPALAAQARKSACKGTDMYVLHVGGTITTTVVWQTPNHSSMCVAE